MVTGFFIGVLIASIVSLIGSGLRTLGKPYATSAELIIGIVAIASAIISFCTLIGIWVS